MTDAIAAARPLWVFAYGSLMWNPGFTFEERRRARMQGYVRRFCLSSITYRGAPGRPGLVLALDAAPGGCCDGMVFRVPEAERAETLDYLRRRELVTYAYEERLAPVRLCDDAWREGEAAEALAYVALPEHAQYQGGLSLAEQAAIIRTAHGQAGSNIDYFESCMAHLAELGVQDAELEALAEEIARG